MAGHTFSGEFLISSQIPGYNHTVVPGRNYISDPRDIEQSNPPLTRHKVWLTLHKVWLTLHKVWLTLHKLWRVTRCGASQGVARHKVWPQGVARHKVWRASLRSSPTLTDEQQATAQSCGAALRGG